MRIPVLITPPGQEPVTAVEVKAQSKIQLNLEDDLLDLYAASARQQVESTECDIQLLTATYELRLDCFPACGPIVLPKPPLQSVTYIKYVDTNGVEQTLSSSVYTVDAKSGHDLNLAEIYLAYGQAWPSIRYQHDGIKIRYVCGFGDDPEDVPVGIRNWISIMASTMHRHREKEITGVIVSEMKYVDRLLDPWRCRIK